MAFAFHVMVPIFTRHQFLPAKRLLATKEYLFHILVPIGCCAKQNPYGDMDKNIINLRTINIIMCPATSEKSNQVHRPML